jgi:ribose transport system permease protein
VLSSFNFGSVQSFVTNLAYGVILVISLLLTLLIPVIQRYIRNFSPLLYFVALSVVVLGIILHATFDYGSLGAVGAYVSGPFDLQASLIAPLETASLSSETESLRLAAAPFVFSSIILIIVAVFIRLAVGQSSRRTIGPAVAVVVAALALAGAYAIAEGVPTTQSEVTK